jgi:MoaA/NifB/PqqE/SkfB family radical SAM enzyme
MAIESRTCGVNQMSLKSNFSMHKTRAIESFDRFSKGLELPQHPLTMYIEVSNLCDLQCAMCPTFSAINPERIEKIKYKKREFLDIKEISKLQPYLESALQVHAFGYGEPTIHPDFLEILDTLKYYEVMVDFFTNGMHLTEENCRAIVDGKVSAITISFSGSTKEEYENVYINGDFDVVLDGIRRLAAYKRESGSLYPRIDVNSVGFKHHINKLPEFVRLMGDAGVNLIHVKPLNVSNQIPFLEPFVAAYRPNVEGKIFEEAMAVAKELGVILGVEVFKRNLVSDDADVDDFVKRRRAPNGDRIREKYATLAVESVLGFASSVESVGDFSWFSSWSSAGFDCHAQS